MFNQFCRHFYKVLGILLAVLLLLEYSFNLSAYNKKNFELLKGRISLMLESSLMLDSHVVNASFGNRTHGGVARAGNGTSVGNTSSMAVSSNKSLELCPLVPSNLVGPIKVLQQAPSLEEIEKNFTHVMLGGRFKPKECLARHRVAILVPYRNREKQLNVFLHNMHQFLPRQQIDYGIFVIEQDENGKFNRAKLFNVGYLESLALYDYECFIFHDVDLVPEDDRILYTCPEKPRHLSVAISTLEYRLPYYRYFGGASVLSKKHMELVNGFSNLYWGWGGEDDDMFSRLQHSNLDITRYPAEIARYTMLGHVKETPSPERFMLLSGARSRYHRDGLNSVKYERKKLVLKKLYTWILVDLKAP